MMSTTGNPLLPPPTAAAAQLLYGSGPSPDDRQAYADHGVKISRTIGSPGYPADEATVRERVLAEAARNYSPAGRARQLVAVAASGDRRAKLKTIKVPTVVLHGAEDPLVRVQAGEETAACIANAQLRIIPGMGHDLPAQLYPTFTDAIMTAVRRAGASRN